MSFSEDFDEGGWWRLSSRTSDRNMANAARSESDFSRRFAFQGELRRGVTAEVRVGMLKSDTPVSPQPGTPKVGMSKPATTIGRRGYGPGIR